MTDHIPDASNMVYVKSVTLTVGLTQYRRRDLGPWLGYDYLGRCRSVSQTQCEMLDHIAILTAQLAAAKADGAMLADSVEDFIGAQGTAYEADQYLMLQGVLREYHARTGAR